MHAQLEPETMEAAKERLAKMGVTGSAAPNGTPAQERYAREIISEMVTDHEAKVNNRRSEGGKKAAATRKANAAKPAAPATGGGITDAQANKLTLLIAAKSNAQEAWQESIKISAQKQEHYVQVSKELEAHISSLVTGTRA